MSDSATLFDADALAIEPPELRIGGKVYRGRILSIVEWARYFERFLAAAETEAKDITERGVLSSATLLADHAFCLEYLRAVLPKPKKPGTPDPVTLLERAGDRILKQAFARFFGHQCYAHGVALRTPTVAAREVEAAIPGPPTSAAGTSSSDSIARAPSADAASG